MHFTRKTLHVGAIAIMLSTVATVTTFVTADAAYAERGGNGNGNGNGRNRDNDRSERGNSGNSNSGNSNRGGNGNGRGAIASELKWMNAANANPNALANAAPNSRPGQLNTFKTEYVAAQEAVTEAEGAVVTTEEDLLLAQANLDALLATDPLAYESVAGETYDEAVAAAETSVDDATLALGTAQSDLTEAQLAADAVIDGLTGGRELSEAAFEELLAMLGL